MTSMWFTRGKVVPPHQTMVIWPSINHEAPSRIDSIRRIFPGFEMLNLAFRQDYLVDQDGAFATSDQLDSSMAVYGRVRRVVCFRRGHSFDRVDGLSITPNDLTAMDLHPATLQYSRRTTTEGRFWSVDKSRLSLLLAFSSHPRTPHDFPSMTYDLKSRTSTVLIRQSHNSRRDDFQELDEYDNRLEAPTAARDPLPVLSRLF